MADGRRTSRKSDAHGFDCGNLKQIAVRFERQTFEMLRRDAEAKGVSVSERIRQLVLHGHKYGFLE